jgi:hypothetical protein
MAIARRSRAVLALSLLVSGAVLSSNVASAAAPDRRPALPRGAVDITDTVKGQRLIREAKERYAGKGHKAGALRAVKDATGILIAPVDTTFDTYPITLENGSLAMALAPVTADDPEPGDVASVAGELALAAAPTWSLLGNHCFTQISDTWATLDHCYYKYKLANDGSGSYDWFALHRFGTASNNSPWVLDQAKIRAYRYSGSSQAWADWTPRTNWSGGSCSSVSIGISTPVGGLSKSFERCPEKVTFTKSANGTQPDYTQTWTGRRTRGNRELSFEIAVRVKQNGTATWTLPASVNGGPY